ncbi:MAG: endonuclease III [Phycisphaeraceae bacterium]
MVASKLVHPSVPRSRAARRELAAWYYDRLVKQYPDAHCALVHGNPFELLVATILSAQCTDVRVNMVTPGLFAQFPSPKAFVAAKLTDIENAIKSTGFFRNKAKAIQGASRLIVEKHGGRVPDTMDELLELPGVARKTANVVLGNAFGKSEGVVVDTHVQRLSRRMGLTRMMDPKKIEQELMVMLERSRWTLWAHLLIFHGRRICTARKPACETCPLVERCPKVGVVLKR